VGALLIQLIQIYIYIIILDVTLSFVTMANPRGGGVHTVKRFLEGLTEPALYPIRRVLQPYMRGVPIDISPIILIFALNLLQMIIGRIFY
jgi:YggT family protein